MDTHRVSHPRTRLEGDTVVNLTFDCSVSREENAVRKKSTRNEAEAEFLKAVNVNTVQGEITSFTGENCDRDRQQFNRAIFWH